MTVSRKHSIFPLCKRFNKPTYDVIWQNAFLELAIHRLSYQWFSLQPHKQRDGSDGAYGASGVSKTEHSVTHPAICPFRLCQRVAGANWPRIPFDIQLNTEAIV